MEGRNPFFQNKKLCRLALSPHSWVEPSSQLLIAVPGTQFALVSLQKTMKAVKAPSSNWKALQKKISSEEKSTPRNSKEGASSRKQNLQPLVRNASTSENVVDSASLGIVDQVPAHERERYVALDCEMVGLGSAGKQSALARCCVVNFDGEVLYDKFVRPKGFVTDFRTKYSGVRKSDLRKGEACLFEECQSDVANLIKNKVLVGHAIMNDMEVLMLSHPRGDIRDTAHYRPLMRTIGHEHIKYRPRALRDLAKQYLNIKIQDGEHDPGVDARTAMMLYRKFRGEWEKNIQSKKYGAKSASDSSATSTDSKKKRKHVSNHSENRSQSASFLNDVDLPVDNARKKPKK